MRASESTAKLAEALSTAQGQFKPPAKTRTVNVGSYKYSYADLADVIEALRAPLAGNGLAVIQAIDADEKGPVLITRLLHASGEWVESFYRLPQGLTGQQFGSALTYGRRYSLSAIVGIAAEDDDDGAAAEKAPPSPPVSQKNLLAALIEAAREAHAAGKLDEFRVDPAVKEDAAKLGPANLEAFKKVIKELAGTSV